MNRLTKKEYKHLVYSSGYYNKKQISKFDEVYHKLGKLEDLEDELGCPLEVVFEALKEGIVIPKEDKWYPTVRLEKFKIDGDWNFTWQCGNIKLSDYKKTWWLPSDKEWKDE